MRRLNQGERTIVVDNFTEFVIHKIFCYTKDKFIKTVKDCICTTKTLSKRYKNTVRIKQHMKSGYMQQ